MMGLLQVRTFERGERGPQVVKVMEEEAERKTHWLSVGPPPHTLRGVGSLKELQHTHTHTHTHIINTHIINTHAQRMKSQQLPISMQRRLYRDGGQPGREHVGCNSGMGHNNECTSLSGSYALCWFEYITHVTLLLYGSLNLVPHCVFFTVNYIYPKQLDIFIHFYYIIDMQDTVIYLDNDET